MKEVQDLSAGFQEIVNLKPPKTMKSTHSNPQIEWRKKALSYTGSINQYVQKGLTEGWEAAGAQPLCPKMEHLVPDLLSALREAFRTKTTDRLRELWPPVHEPLLEHLREHGQSIPTVCLLEDGSILARIGSPYDGGHVVHISGDSCEKVRGATFFGISPNRHFFAWARPDRVSVTEGWEGVEVASFKWPTGQEDLPAGIEVPQFDQPPVPTRLIPFPDGKRVLLVSSRGIFVLAREGAKRLLPTDDEIIEQHRYIVEENPQKELSFQLPMDHGAISPDGKFIAVGHQMSLHLVFDENLNCISQIGHRSEYAHYAIFSSDSKMLALNSCHFYYGRTIGVQVNQLPGLVTEPYEEDERTPLIENGARVYAGVHRGDEFIIGDAYGYVRAFDMAGNPRWQHFVGSSIGDMDISPDGKTLVVSTYAGFISIIKLDAGERPAYQIGTGNHIEQRRWIFWKNEPTPLIW
jgi:hypothetical protein